MHEAGIRTTPLCPHCMECGESLIETIEHIGWVCKKWEPQRKKWIGKYDKEMLKALPQCTRLCGIKTKNKEIFRLQKNLKPEEPTDPMPPDRHEGEIWDGFYNNGRLVVASDGACPNQQGDARTRRSGQGLFYGKDHAYNSAWPTGTYSQGAQRAETRAPARWVSWAWGPTELWTDSQNTHDAITRILQGLPHGMTAHVDQWQRIEGGMKAKGLENFASQKVEGHAEWKDCEGNEDKIEKKNRNDQADELAVKGAKAHQINETKMKTFAAERRVARDIQKMWIEILDKRYEEIRSKSPEQFQKEMDQAEDFKEINTHESDHESNYEEDMWADLDMDGNTVTTIKGPTKADDHDKEEHKEEENEANGGSIGEINGRKNYPGYKWDQKEDGGNWFEGTVPPEKVTNSTWKYSPSLYDALVWYWRTLKWENVEEGQTTWAQIALDFQGATHEDLAREDKDPNEETVSKRAVVMRAATTSLEALFDEEAVPGGTKGYKQVGSLQPMDYNQATGIKATPILMKKN